MSLLTDVGAIKDIDENVWDEMPWDLPGTGPEQLPWKGTVTVYWNGELSSGDLADDGQYDLRLVVTDEDGNSCYPQWQPSQEVLISFLYDKTRPVGTISVSPKGS